MAAHTLQVPFFTPSFQSLGLYLLATDIGRRKEVLAAKYFPSISVLQETKEFFWLTHCMQISNIFIGFLVYYV